MKYCRNTGFLNAGSFNTGMFDVGNAKHRQLQRGHYNFGAFKPGPRRTGYLQHGRRQHRIPECGLFQYGHVRRWERETPAASTRPLQLRTWSDGRHRDQVEVAGSGAAVDAVDVQGGAGVAPKSHPNRTAPPHRRAALPHGRMGGTGIRSRSLGAAPLLMPLMFRVALVWRRLPGAPASTAATAATAATAEPAATAGAAGYWLGNGGAGGAGLDAGSTGATCRVRRPQRRRRQRRRQRRNRRQRRARRVIGWATRHQPAPSRTPRPWGPSTPNETHATLPTAATRRPNPTKSIHYHTHAACVQTSASTFENSSTMGSINTE